VVSKKAAVCPHCGRPLRRSGGDAVRLVFAALCGIGLIWFCMELAADAAKAP